MAQRAVTRCGAMAIGVRSDEIRRVISMGEA